MEEKQKKQRKNRRFANNGPTLQYQRKLINGEITTAEFLQHAKDRLLQR